MVTILQNAPEEGIHGKTASVHPLPRDSKISWNGADSYSFLAGKGFSAFAGSSPEKFAQQKGGLLLATGPISSRPCPASAIRHPEASCRERAGKARAALHQESPGIHIALFFSAYQISPGNVNIARLGKDYTRPRAPQGQTPSRIFPEHWLPESFRQIFPF